MGVTEGIAGLSDYFEGSVDTDMTFVFDDV